MDMNTTEDVLTGSLHEHTDVARYLEELHETAWQVVDPVVLELCRLRIATLLGCQPEQDVRTPEAVAAGLEEATIAELTAWPSSARFGPRERTCLAFCEQFVIDVATLSNDLAVAVSDELGPEAFVNFAYALLVVEQRQRIRLAWSRLFEPAPER